MATRLSTISEMTKKGAVFLAIGIVVFLVLRVIFQAAITALTPPPPTPTPFINPKYGVLPKLNLPDTATSSNGQNISLETVSGDIPVGTGSAAIYEIRQSAVALDYGDKAQKVAQGLFINNAQPIKTNNSTFIFQDPKEAGKQLEVNYINFNYHLKYDNPASYIAIEKGNTISNAVAQEQVKNILTNTRQEILTENVFINPLVMNGSYSFFNPTTQTTDLVPNQAQANLTTVDVYRVPLGKVPVIESNTQKSLVNFVYTGITASGAQGSANRLLQADVTYWNINPQVTAVYLLRTPQSAYQDDLLGGKGYILSPVAQGEEYLVRKVYLAYYNPPTLQAYMLPVWVFEGDKRSDANFLFRAIVPAVSKGYIEE